MISSLSRSCRKHKIKIDGGDLDGEKQKNCSRDYISNIVDLYSIFNLLYCNKSIRFLSIRIEKKVNYFSEVTVSD